MHPRVVEVTDRLIQRSRATRQRYLEMIRTAASEGPQRGKLQCANFAHGVAGCSGHDKQTLRLMDAANATIVQSMFSLDRRSRWASRLKSRTD